MQDFYDRLRDIDGYLYPELGGVWSVCAIDGSAEDLIFVGWGDTPEEALADAEAEVQYKKRRNV